ncbi:hypothetical protein BDV97DRAFT_401715 [Delphinella strobiligena]|nr:hypothetical protein BDV97DRAFT_401715 [Delphinella strobiligena]
MGWEVVEENGEVRMDLVHHIFVGNASAAPSLKFSLAWSSNAHHVNPDHVMVLLLRDCQPLALSTTDVWKGEAGYIHNNNAPPSLSASSSVSGAVNPTFGPSQEDQSNLFGQMVEDHNALTEAPSAPVAVPVTSTVLPIAAHYSRYRLDMSADDVAHAESELFNFEAMLKDALALELEAMERKDWSLSSTIHNHTHHPTMMAQNPGLHNNEISMSVGRGEVMENTSWKGCGKCPTSPTASNSESMAEIDFTDEQEAHKAICRDKETIEASS